MLRKSEIFNVNLFRIVLVSFVKLMMILLSYFFVFFFGLLVLRVVEVSFFGRKVVKGKFLFFVIFSVF